MDNKINFTSRSNEYFAITKKGWQSAIPHTAYNQINTNRARLEKFARKNNLKITFTDGNNMLPEFYSSRERNYLSKMLAMEVEKKPSIVTRIKTAFSNIGSNIAMRINKKPKVTLSTVSFYEKDSKNIPALKENGKMGLFVEYEPTENNCDKRINLDTVVDFLQKVAGKNFQ